MKEEWGKGNTKKQRILTPEKEGKGHVRKEDERKQKTRRWHTNKRGRGEQTKRRRKKNEGGKRRNTRIRWHTKK